MSETAEQPKTVIETVDLSNLGEQLFTETVEVDPTVDVNAPSRPIDEIGQDGKVIIYKALITPPGPDATDYNGNARQFVSRLSGIIGKGDRKGQPWEAYKVNFDLKIVEFSDPNTDQTLLQGRAGKFHEESVTTFQREKDGKPYSELSDLAAALGIFSGVELAEGQSTLNVSIGQLLQAVGNVISSGTGVVGVSVKWHAGYIKGDGAKVKGKWTFQGQRNFPKNKDGSSQFVVSANGQDSRVTVKVNGFHKV